MAKSSSSKNKTDNASAEVVVENKRKNDKVQASAKSGNTAVKAKKVAVSEKKPNIFKRLAKLFKEIISEVKKVTWPQGKTVVAQTGIVIVVVLFFFLTLLGIDSLLSYLLKLLVGQA